MNLDARLRQIARWPLSVAISAGATFIAAMIRTSCSVKPRVVIFHISAPAEGIEIQLRPVYEMSLQQPASGDIGKSCNGVLGIWCRRRLVPPGEEAIVLLEDLKVVLLP